MTVRLTHPVWGERTEPDRLRVAYENVGWSAAGEVVPAEVDKPMQDVLADVGDDVGRAQAALAAEQGREKPRQTLVTALARVIDKQED